MQPGVSSYTYTWAVGVAGSMPADPLTAYGLINKAREKGIGTVQFADNLPLEKLSADELDNIRNFAGAKGIKIEMGSRGLTPEHTLKCLAAAEILKSPILRMVIDAEEFRPDIFTVISIIRDLMPEFKRRKIKLAIENHDRFKAREFARIINDVASDHAGICLDSVNSMGAGEGFETVSEILIPLTVNLHVKDFTIFRPAHKMGIIIEGRPAGKGLLDIPALISKIEPTGLCQSAILELWTPPCDSTESTIKKEDEWANESIEYLKKLFQTII